MQSMLLAHPALRPAAADASRGRVNAAVGAT